MLSKDSTTTVYLYLPCARRAHGFDPVSTPCRVPVEARSVILGSAAGGAL